jgi:NAD(P)-dependent dehydrogenase (short-subunit alcohol dehydrogenase family)
MPGQTLAGKPALVTGSSAGIGVAIAPELLSRRTSVVVNCPFPALSDEAQKVASGRPTASTSIAVEADLSTVDGPQKLIDAAVASYQTVHILVNTAGLVVNKPLAQQTLEDWD